MAASGSSLGSRTSRLNCPLDRWKGQENDECSRNDPVELTRYCQKPDRWVVCVAVPVHHITSPNFEGLRTHKEITKEVVTVVVCIIHSDDGNQSVKTLLTGQLDTPEWQEDNHVTVRVGSQTVFYRSNASRTTFKSSAILLKSRRV